MPLRSECSTLSSMPSDLRAVTVNPRRYARLDRPLVVVCLDGSEPDYIGQAVAAGAMPYLAAALPSGTPITWPTA